ncbi:MAG: hypothetical protein KAS57_03885 [Gammaproteobacteria bacterium]|nr:hypothetical protein [Gammaproteobacteria bacterium]
MSNKEFTPPQTEVTIVIKQRGQTVIEENLWQFFHRANAGLYRRMNHNILEDLTEIEIKTRNMTHYVKKPALEVLP